MSSSPAILRLIRDDHIARGLTFMVTVMWALVALFFVFVLPKDDDDAASVAIFGALCLLTTIGCGGWAAWRVAMLRRLILSGVETPGRVVTVAENSEEIWYMILAYDFDGRAYQTKNVTGTHPGYEPGQIVTLLVDPHRPKRAVVAALYRHGAADPDR